MQIHIFMQEERTETGLMITLREVCELFNSGPLWNYVNARNWRINRFRLKKGSLRISLFCDPNNELKPTTPNYAVDRLTVGLKLAIRIEASNVSPGDNEWLIPYKHKSTDGMITWLMVDDGNFQDLVYTLLPAEREAVLGGEAELTDQEEEMEGVNELSDKITRLKQSHRFVNYVYTEGRITQVLKKEFNEANLREGLESLIIVRRSLSKGTEQQCLLPYEDEGQVTWIKLSNGQIAALVREVAPEEGRRLYEQVLQGAAV